MWAALFLSLSPPIPAALLGTFCFVQVIASCLVGLCRPLFCSSHNLMSDRFVQAIVSSLVFDSRVQASVSSQSLPDVLLVVSKPLFRPTLYLMFHRFVQAIISFQSLLGV